MTKTNAMRLLEAAKIPFEVIFIIQNSTKVTPPCVINKFKSDIKTIITISGFIDLNNTLKGILLSATIRHPHTMRMEKLNIFLHTKEQTMYSIAKITFVRWSDL